MMAMTTPSTTHWYRRVTWTEEDQQAFFSRLMQSQSTFHKAQYTRIQADTLLAAGTREAIAAARSLYAFVAREYPHEESQLLLAHVGQAECSAELGERQDTIDALFAALSAHRSHPQWHPTGLLVAGRVAVRDRLTDVYHGLDGALSDLMRKRAFMLPVDLYTACYVLAFISEHLKDLPRAQTYAQSALRAMAMSESNVRRLPPVGLVRQPSMVIYERLRHLANGK
jgi:hypothetical protein